MRKQQLLESAPFALCPPTICFLFCCRLCLQPLACSAFQSTGFTPAAWTLINNSPEPGVGRGASSNRNTPALGRSPISRYLLRPAPDLKPDHLLAKSPECG